MYYIGIAWVSLRKYCLAIMKKGPNCWITSSGPGGRDTGWQSPWCRPEKNVIITT